MFFLMLLDQQPLWNFQLEKEKEQEVFSYSYLFLK